MKSMHGFKQKRILEGQLSALIAGAALCLGAASCVAAGTYNPDALPSDQVGQIAQICRNVLGLNPKEPPISGVHPGTPHLEPDVSHYQGCIASLSDSVQSNNDALIARQADASCRTKGLQTGSSELAMCVLETAKSNASRPPAPQWSSVPMTDGAPGKPSRVGSFNYASPHETLRREQLACAQLGLEPPEGGFARCVRSLQATFFAIDNPLD